MNYKEITYKLKFIDRRRLTDYQILLIILLKKFIQINPKNVQTIASHLWKKIVKPIAEIKNVILNKKAKEKNLNTYTAIKSTGKNLLKTYKANS